MNNELTTQPPKSTLNCDTQISNCFHKILLNLLFPFIIEILRNKLGSIQFFFIKI